jgi:aminomethyltransferase
MEPVDLGSCTPDLDGALADFSRFVELDHTFVGRPVLDQQAKEGTAQRLCGLSVEEPGAIPRHGTPIYSGEERVTEATSGGLSPTLGKGIALAYLPTALTSPGTPLGLEIRGREAAGQVVALPFLKAGRPRT